MNSLIHSVKTRMLAVMLILIPLGGFAEYDADGIDLVGRYPYGYCTTIFASGQHFYSANGTVLEVRDTQTQEVVAELVTESIVSGVHIDGNYAYVANWSDGLMIVDISDPMAPVEVARLAFEGQCWDVSISGDHAYVGNDVQGLRIVDISLPSAPVLVATYGSDLGASFEYCQVIGTRAYAATQSGLYILDVSDPANPAELGFSPELNGSWHVQVVDNIAYLSEFANGIRIVNVADPTNPQDMGFFTTAGPAYWMEADGAVGYVAVGSAGIELLDLSDLTHPDSIGMYDTDFADAFNIQGDTLYLAASSWGIELIDISNPPNLVSVGSDPGAGYAVDVLSTGDYLYAAVRGLGLGVFSMVDREDPSLVALVEMENPTKLNRSGDLLFVADNYNLHIVDISDPTDPIIRSTWFDGTVMSISSEGNLLYLGGYPDLQILDVSDPNAPQSVGILDDLPNASIDLSVKWPYAYLANRSGGVWIVNITDLTTPSTVGGFQDMDYALSLSAAGNLLYVTDRYVGELVILDISNPEAPTRTATFPVGMMAEDVASSGRYAYVLDSWNGVRIIECWEPTGPAEVGHFNTGGYAKAIYADAGQLSVADGGGGLYLLYTDLQDEPSGSAYTVQNSRIRVVDTAPIHPLANPEAYAVTGTTITVEAWVFPTRMLEEGATAPIVIRPYSNADAPRSYELMVTNQDGSGQPKFAFAATDGMDPNLWASAMAATPVQVGEWTHLAGSYDGSLLRLYINGNQVAETPFNGSLGTGGTGLYLGRVSGPTFLGLMDEVRLWNTTRSTADIQTTMNAPLAGNESGLAGYWPMDDSYLVQGLPVTADASENHNDLWIQGMTGIVPFPAGSEVQLAPEPEYKNLTAVIGQLLELDMGVSSGWPFPNISLLDGPAGMTIDPITNTLSWTPAIDQRGWHEFTYRASNDAGSAESASIVWVDMVPLETMTQDISNADLTFANNGIMGYYGHFDENQGFTFNGVNGLYAANLVFATSESQVSGGLYVEEFGMLSGIEPIESDLDGFDQAYATRYDDARANNPMGISVRQRTHAKSTSPDEDYIIVEYELSNDSDVPITGLYVGLSADWDVGVAAANLGGYEPEQNLSYTYEVDAANNPYYYGTTLLSHPVSGHSLFAQGGGNDAATFEELTSFPDWPGEASDIRSTLGAGPFQLFAGGSMTLVYALVGGEDLADLQTNADRAHEIYRVLHPNLASAYLYEFSRIRVTDSAPIHPEANPGAYTISGNTITVEAWVFPTALPGENQKIALVQRPYWNAEPFYAWELSLDNQNGTGFPCYGFSVTDGNVPAAGVSVIGANGAVLGEWTHIAGSFDGNMVRLYVNGELVGQDSYNGSIGPGNTGLYLGGLSNGLTLQGLLDEVRLWNVARSQAEIQSSMNGILVGSEPGLAGYWPLDASYESTNGLAVADLSPNHNDLLLQGNAQILGFPAGSAVFLAPVHQYYSLTAVINELLEFTVAASSGWPLASASLLEGPAGLSIDPSTNLLSWTPVEGQRGWHEFSYELSNAAGSASGVSHIWVDAVGLETVTHDIGNADLTYANNGVMGFYGHSDQNEGFRYNGVNGLYAGNLMLGLSGTQVSGGLFVEEFGMLSGITPVASSLLGFEQVFESSFDDARAPQPLGINVLQRTHAGSNAADEDYVILEYVLTNTNDGPVTGLYAGVSTDWDIGDPYNNLAGYDAGRGLSYVYEVGGAQNPYYYGVVALNQVVSGQSALVDGGYDDALNYDYLTTFTELPMVAQDIRMALGCGPFDLAADETVVVSFAILGAENLDDLRANADRARSIYTVSTDEEASLPMTFALYPNYPNPFNPSTRINYALPEDARVTLSILNIRGQQVAVLVNTTQRAGRYQVQWRGLDQFGKQVSAGIYFCRMQAGDFTGTIKMLYLE